MWLCVDTNIEEIFIFRTHFSVCFEFAGVCEETVGCFLASISDDQVFNHDTGQGISCVIYCSVVYGFVSYTTR